jgi:hypothetical protein
MPCVANFPGAAKLGDSDACEDMLVLVGALKQRLSSGREALETARSLTVGRSSMLSRGREEPCLTMFLGVCLSEGQVENPNIFRFSHKNCCAVNSRNVFSLLEKGRRTVSRIRVAHASCGTRSAKFPRAEAPLPILEFAAAANERHPARVRDSLEQSVVGRSPECALFSRLCYYLRVGPRKAAMPPARPPGRETLGHS